MKIYHYHGRCNVSGINLRRLREKKKLTQDQVSARMQVIGIPLDQKAISRMETGDRVVADYELKALASILDTEVETLLEEKTE